jgi:hypothetical protein
MIIFAKIILFLLGMSICVQIIGALYGIIDLWYTLRTAYVFIIRRFLTWSLLTAFIAGLLGNELRPAFLWGCAAFILIYILGFFGHQLLFKRNSRLLGL